jgi:glycosyltransferase involved in cell wall biosynthesis
MVKLSIIVAVYNEEDNIKPLIDNITNVFLDSGIEHEVIFVDDGSDDNTANTIRDNIKQNIFCTVNVVTVKQR